MKRTEGFQTPKGYRMEPEQIADVLDDAADYIEQHGWWDGGRKTMALIHAACVVTAVQKQNMDSRTVCDVLAPVAETLGLDGLWSITDITAWNDSQTDAQPVLDALRAAAKQQRAAAITSRVHGAEADLLAAVRSARGTS